jgi:hypothetical protein
MFFSSLADGVSVGSGQEPGRGYLLDPISYILCMLIEELNFIPFEMNFI